MLTLRVFDPAMCCSTGVCGPSVDPRLTRFSADLDWLRRQGVTVERFNLAQEPAAFVQDAAVKAALDAEGEASLPLVQVNGEVKSRGVYPTRVDLAAWAGVALPRLQTAPAETASGCCGPATSDVAKNTGCC